MAEFLRDIPAGTLVFIDSNIFHLYLRGPETIREVCTSFLERIERGEIKGITSVLVLDELAYKLLLRRIEELYEDNPLQVLKNRREAIIEAASYVRKGLEITLGIENLRILSVNYSHLEYFTEFMEKYSLLPRDALHLAVMMDTNCTNIASADKDFDSISIISRWTPIMKQM